MTPVYPFMEVEVRPPVLRADGSADPDEPIVTLSRDSADQWWHTVAGEPVRRATFFEVLLPANVKVWQSLGIPAKGDR